MNGFHYNIKETNPVNVNKAPCHLVCFHEMNNFGQGDKSVNQCLRPLRANKEGQRDVAVHHTQCGC